VILDELPQTACDCVHCKAMCYGRPCWGRPDDMKRIISAGHGDMLMLDWAEIHGKTVELLTPAISGYQGQDAPFWPQGKCAFLDPEDHCLLHQSGLKPIEGRVSSCKGGVKLTEVHHAIGALWAEDAGKEIVHSWRASHPTTGRRQDVKEFVSEYVPCADEEEAANILWSFTAFPFGDVITIKAQLAHIKEVGFEQVQREQESQLCRS